MKFFYIIVNNKISLLKTQQPVNIYSGFFNTFEKSHFY